MNKQFTISLVFILLFFQGITQWYWENPLPQGNSISSLHMLGNNGFAVASHGAILKTDNDGASWTLMDSVTSYDLTSVYIGQPEYAHVVGDLGTIFQTTNGTDWNSIKSGTHYKLYGVASTPSASKTFAIGYKGIILKTEIDWVEFENINSPTLFTLYAIDFATDQVGVIVGDSGTILRTDNSGESWNQVANESTRPLRDVHFPSSTVGYAVGGKGTIIKTIDAGSTWTEISFAMVENDLKSVYFDGDSSGCVVGTFGLVLTTVDGGLNWTYHNTQQYGQFITSYYEELGNDTIDCPSMLLGGANGMIYKSDSCGNEWINTTNSSQYSLNDITFPAPSFGYAIGGDPYGDKPFMLRYNDTSWVVHEIPVITHYLTEIFFLNPEVGYTCGINASIYKTIDAGITWSPLNSGIEDETLYSISFINNLLGFAAGTNGTIIKTTSGDTVWTPLNTGTTKNLYSMYLSGSYNGGFAVGESGTILKIESGGNAIFPVTSNTNEHLYDVFIKSDSVAFVVGFNGTILKVRSVFGTDEVLSIPSGVTTPLNDIYFTNDSTGFIAGEGGVILKTTNRGNDWYPQYSGTSNNLRAVLFTDLNTGFITGSGATILKTTNGGGSVILPFISENSQSDYNVQIYPNPVSNYTWIDFELDDKSEVQVRLFDLSGREIKIIMENRQLQGKQKVKMNAADIQPGIYLVVLKVNDQLITEKLIVY